jgi:3-oxoacyl-[acyl-carrier-protein] synthase II
VVAAVLGVHGPAATFSTACSSSGTAIAHAVDMLRAGQIRVVVAGGADGFSKLTLCGFQALGAVADGPCGPFGSRIGISLGEGAAFVVLERLDDALARGAEPLAEVLACATTWDAHHLTAPEPSGDGMRRAIETALAAADLPPEAIGYVNAHGTGTRANDIAETLALKRVFTGGPPPVSATKSFTGHTLGASSAAGLLAGIAGTQQGWLPPTLAFGGTRPGCDLDYVADVARPASVSNFLALSAAFGGCNCAIVAGRVRSRPSAAPKPVLDRVVITGMGVISSLGCDAASAFEAAVGDPEDQQAWPSHEPVARVCGFDPKRHLPRGRSSRMSAITQFAVAAIEQALTQAGWTAARRRPTEIGLMVGLSRGAAGSFQTCMESVIGGAWGKVSPTAFPHLVMSSVGGQASVAVGLKGPASTIVGEAEVGLTLLGQAAAFLAQRPQLDALVVLTADELSPLFLDLGRSAYGVPALPLADGAVALVLEQQKSAEARGADILAEVAGWAQTFDAGPGELGADDDGTWVEHAIRSALVRAGETPDSVGMAMTLRRGQQRMDQRESMALGRVFGNAIPPVGALPGRAGWAEASGGLLSVAMAVTAFRQGRVPWQTAAADGPGPLRNALVTGSSKHGSNAAVLLRRWDGASDNASCGALDQFAA